MDVMTQHVDSQTGSRRRVTGGQALVFMLVSLVFAAVSIQGIINVKKRVEFSHDQRALLHLAVAVTTYNLDYGNTRVNYIPKRLAALTTPVRYLAQIPVLDTDAWDRVGHLPTARAILTGATDTTDGLAFDCGCELPGTRSP